MGQADDTSTCNLHLCHSQLPGTEIFCGRFHFLSWFETRKHISWIETQNNRSTEIFCGQFHFDRDLKIMILPSSLVPFSTLLHKIFLIFLVNIIIIIIMIFTGGCEWEKDVWAFSRKLQKPWSSKVCLQVQSFSAKESLFQPKKVFSAKEMFEFWHREHISQKWMSVTKNALLLHAQKIMSPFLFAYKNIYVKKSSFLWFKY